MEVRSKLLSGQPQSVVAGGLCACRELGGSPYLVRCTSATHGSTSQHVKYIVCGALRMMVRNGSVMPPGRTVVGCVIHATCF